MNRLVLIDGNAVMHRSYHALPPLTAPDGRPVHIVYGFISVVIKLFSDLKPTHMAVAFDRPGPTFRNELLPSYQAQRPKMERDFIDQISLVHDAVAAFGIPMFEKDGFEADDMIGTICAQAGHTGIDQVIIVTGDRDILQLVDGERVLVYMPTKGISEGKLYGEKDVRERMGVLPKQVVDLKALMGDASDNYSGVAGIGPKTAHALLDQFGTVDALYGSLQSVASESIRRKLTLGEESAMLSKNLATIRRDAPISFDEHKACLTTLDTPAIRKVLEEFHFPSLLGRMTGRVIIKTQVKQPEQVKKQSQQQELF